MNVVFTKETLRRALRTFLQAFLGYIVANFAIVDVTTFDEAFKSALIGLLVGALSAGLSAIMNLEPLHDANEDETIDSEEEA